MGDGGKVKWNKVKEFGKSLFCQVSVKSSFEVEPEWGGIQKKQIHQRGSGPSRVSYTESLLARKQFQQHGMCLL